MYRFELCEADTPSLRFEVNETNTSPLEPPQQRTIGGQVVTAARFRGLLVRVAARVRRVEAAEALVWASIV